MPQNQLTILTKHLVKNPLVIVQCGWFKKFRSGDKNLEDEESRRRPSVNVEQHPKTIVEQNPRQCVREKAKAVGVSLSII